MNCYLIDTDNMNEFEQMLFDRFYPKDADMVEMIETGILPTISALSLAHEDGLEDELISFLGENPDATLEETVEFYDSLLSPMIIVDESELDEHERTEK